MRKKQLLIQDLNIEDQCMVHRYLYYVLFEPIISDYEYDMLEKEAEKVAPEDHPIHRHGSDLKSSYDKKIIDIANNLLGFNCRTRI